VSTENDYSFIGNNPGTTAPANSVGVTKALILNYSDAAKLTQVISQNGLRTATGTMILQNMTTQWENTAAITRITVQGNVAANLLAGSWIQIIGIKTMDVVTDVTLA